jgi:hypothetical protein
MANRREDDPTGAEGGGGSWWDQYDIPGPTIYDDTGAPAAAPADRATATQGPDAFGGNYQAWFQSLIAGKPYNQQTLLELEPILAQYGVKLTPPNASGERTKIQLPDGSWVRVGFGEGHPVWVVQPTGNAQLAASGSGAPVTNPYGEFAQGPGAIPPPYASAAYGGPNWTPPVLPANLQQSYVPPTWSEQFTAPTAEQARQTPGYQFTLGEGQNAIQRSAAAKGSILNPGTLKALDRYSQGLADTTYAGTYQRAFDEYRSRYGQFTDAAQLGLQGRQQNYGEYQGQAGLGLTANQNQYARYLDDEARKRADYGLNYTTQSADPWSRYAQLAGYGLQAALGSKTSVPPLTG